MLLVSTQPQPLRNNLEVHSPFSKSHQWGGGGGLDGHINEMTLTGTPETTLEWKG